MVLLYLTSLKINIPVFLADFFSGLGGYRRPPLREFVFQPKLAEEGGTLPPPFCNLFKKKLSKRIFLPQKNPLFLP